MVLLDDPARGIDISSKQEIYGLIRQMAASGCIVLMHSSEMSELAGLCDRVLAFHRGQLAGEVTGADMDAVAVRRLITGDETAAPAEQAVVEFGELARRLRGGQEALLPMAGGRHQGARGEQVQHPLPILARAGRTGDDLVQGLHDRLGGAAVRVFLDRAAGRGGAQRVILGMRWRGQREGEQREGSGDMRGHGFSFGRCANARKTHGGG